MKLYIPTAIDAYNHHMNGADIANQRQKHCKTQRKHNLHTWRPLFHWLLDIALANFFILWRMQARLKDPKAECDPKEFNQVLADALCIWKSDKVTRENNEVIISEKDSAEG